MNTLDRRTLLLAGFGLSQTGAALAQSPTPDPASRVPPKGPRSILEQVVPKVTGKNGYEELCLAVDALKESALFSKAQNAGAEPVPLSFKRRALADPPVVRARAIMHRGLAKPIQSPRDPQSLSSWTLLPELAGFRNLGRLLRMQQYVMFADGKTAEGVAIARTGLRLGQVVQTDTLISGLVGVAISAICIESLANHLEQLSARDCEQLRAICLEWLNQPDPLPRILDVERRASSAFLRDFETADRQQLKELFGMREDPPEDPREAESYLKTREMVERVARAKEQPEQFHALLVEAGKRMTAVYDQVMTQVRQPAWERELSRAREAVGEDDLAGQLAGQLVPSLTQVDRAYTRESARVRLLLVHAVILRYRWEFDRPPQDLSVLRLGDFAIDPFTGQPLRYELVGSRRYRLVSAGPPASADDPNAVDGRSPVILGTAN